MKEFLRRFRGAPGGWYLPPAVAFLWNQAVYNGSRLFADAKPHHDFTSAFDAMTPFIPFTVSIYWLSFLYFPVVFLLMARQEKTLAYRFFAADMLAKAVCSPCFLFLPTTNIRPVVVGDSLWAFLTRILYQLDAPTNLFPSIHCLLAWLCCLGVRDIPKSSVGAKAAALLAAAAICISTLTTKQHVIVDVLAGVALAELCYRFAEKDVVRGTYARTVECLNRFAAPRCKIKQRKRLREP